MSHEVNYKVVALTPISVVIIHCAEGRDETSAALKLATGAIRLQSGKKIIFNPRVINPSEIAEESGKDTERQRWGVGKWTGIYKAKTYLVDPEAIFIVSDVVYDWFESSKVFPLEEMLRINAFHSKYYNTFEISDILLKSLGYQTQNLGNIPI